MMGRRICKAILQYRQQKKRGVGDQEDNSNFEMTLTRQVERMEQCNLKELRVIGGCTLAYCSVSSCKLDEDDEVS